MKKYILPIIIIIVVIALGGIAYYYNQENQIKNGDEIPEDSLKDPEQENLEDIIRDDALENPVES